MQTADEAEDLAQLWGTRAGFVVNPVRRDRHGWDHLFEMSLPREPKSSDAFGLPTCAFTCRIQVKSVTGDRRSIPVKLTNWKRAIEDPLPWFFLIIRFNGGKPREATLVHIDKAWVERVIAHLCAMPESGKVELHRKTLALTWRDRPTLRQPVDRSLLDAIQGAIGRDAFQYAKAKQEWYENAGYKNRLELSLDLTIGPLPQDEIYKRLARAFVGLDGLESSRVSLSRERFGRKEPLKVRGPISAKMSWGNEAAREGLLSVLDHEGLHLCSLPVSMRSSACLGMVPWEFSLLRLQSPMIDLVVNIGEESLSVNLSLPEDRTPVSLRSLHDNLAFLKCIDDRDGQTIDFSLSRGEHAFSLARLTAQITLSRKHYQLSIDTGALWSLLGHLGTPDADSPITANKVSEIGFAARVMLMSRVGTDAEVFMDLPIEAGEADFSRPVVIVTNPRVRVGAITYMDVIALVAVPTPLPEKDGKTWIRVTPERCLLLLSRRFVGDAIKGFDFQKTAPAVEAELEKHGFSHAIGIDWESCATPTP